MTVFQQVYDIVLRIPKGRVATYGQIARLLGNPRLSRVVGYALHQNPAPGVIPCHRVVDRNGNTATGFAFGGPNVQRDLLEAEGIVFDADGRIDLTRYGWDPFEPHTTAEIMDETSIHRLQVLTPPITEETDCGQKIPSAKRNIKRR